MAVGKNKRLSKGKKGIKKKVVDPFTRKGELLAWRHWRRVKDIKLTTCFFFDYAHQSCFPPLATLIDTSLPQSRLSISNIYSQFCHNFDIYTFTTQTGTISRLPLSSRSVMSERPSSTDLRD